MCVFVVGDGGVVGRLLRETETERERGHVSGLAKNLSGSHCNLVG